jgi:hypothetical protein
VLGDQTQPNRRPTAFDGAGSGSGPVDRATSGPRHAAPRKSLLTKLHVPAGKAVALAAMPTAVLMGMGLTPHLAQADEQSGGSPFKPGPCVTQSDAPGATATDGKKTDQKDQKDQKDPAGKGDQDGKDGSATPTAGPTKGSDSGGDTGTAGDGDHGKADTPDPTVSPSATAKKPAGPDAKTPAKPDSSPTPTPTSSSNPLDPLGLGNLLGGLLGVHKSTPTPSATPTTKAPQPPATTAPPAAPDPADSAAGKPSSGSTGGSKDPVGKTVKGLTDGATDGAKKTLKDLTDAAGTPSPSASGTPDPKATTGTTGKTVKTDGTEGYPCPVYDAKALADAKAVTDIPLLPDQPWTLKSTRLALHGLGYDGIVQVTTEDGQVKDALKFTATGIDIDNLHQIVTDNGGKTTTHVMARAGSTSTFTNGTVTMYTESLSGNLLGVLPITFTPKSPPPLTLPELFFTDVTVIQAGQFGGDLHIPGMQVLPGQPPS